jgi:lycopene cyclase domain-containing protein
VSAPWLDGPHAYLGHLLVWSLPVVLAQLALLVRVYRGRVGAVMKAMAVPVVVVTTWLVAADHLAISSGIWRFGEGKHLGILIGRVPVEEALFFLITNVLVAQGIALFARTRAC